MMPSEFAPGALVRHPNQPDWGTGQVQSVIGDRITVNFEHAGKRLINAKVVKLRAAERPNGPAPRRARDGGTRPGRPWITTKREG
jgi:FKBP-type peptidyl-prolyl cis-trans isomerase 2